MKRTFKIQEIEEVAKEFLSNIGTGVIGFSGNLGAGKTTFTKEVLRQLGHSGNVPSPTFVLRRDYEVEGKKIIHIDAYRLESPEQIYQVISKEELGDKNNLVIIEWPEKVDNGLFDKVFQFEHISEEEREISLMV